MVSVPHKGMVDDVWIAGSLSGPSKLKHMNITLVPSKRVKTPSIKEALANIECKVIDSRDYGDHTFFIGEVVAYTYNRDTYRNHEPIPTAEFLAHIAWNKFITFSGEVLMPRK